jgi:hypothetical protein
VDRDRAPGLGTSSTSVDPDRTSSAKPPPPARGRPYVEDVDQPTGPFEEIREGEMTDGFEAAPGVMDGGASALTAAGGRLGGLGGQASGAASAAGGVNGGPLAGALGALGTELAQRAQALAQAVAATSGNVTTAAGNYEFSDAAASRRIEGTVPGG